MSGNQQTTLKQDIFVRDEVSHVLVGHGRVERKDVCGIVVPCRRFKMRAYTIGYFIPLSSFPGEQVQALR